jgi:hypothetical protein
MEIKLGIQVIPAFLLFHSLPLPSPCSGGSGVTITYVHRRILVHFGHKNQHSDAPGFMI